MQKPLVRHYTPKTNTAGLSAGNCRTEIFFIFPNSQQNLTTNKNNNNTTEIKKPGQIKSNPVCIEKLVLNLFRRSLCLWLFS
jgi:hypothetical protein